MHSLTTNTVLLPKTVISPNLYQVNAVKTYKHTDWLQAILDIYVAIIVSSSIGSMIVRGEGARIMKYKRPWMAAIFFMTSFNRDSGGAWPP